jgi:hypothetical protein
MARSVRSLASGGGEDDWPALQQEAGTERKRTAFAASILQLDGGEVAVNPDDRATPVGRDLLDHESRLSLHVDRATMAASSPVCGEHVGAIAIETGHVGER